MYTAPGAGMRPWPWASDSRSSGSRSTRSRAFPATSPHRAEHWVVIAGEGLVRVGDEEMHLHVDQSVYIPQKTMHRLSNASAQPLEIVEVQTGDYLGEDDIERFDDRYGRE